MWWNCQYNVLSTRCALLLKLRATITMSTFDIALIGYWNWVLDWSNGSHDVLLTLKVDMQSPEQAKVAASEICRLHSAARNLCCPSAALTITEPAPCNDQKQLDSSPGVE